MVWAWCLYSSITCLNGTSTAGLTGGRLFKGHSSTVGSRGGAPILPETAVPRPDRGLFRPQVVPEPTRDPRQLAGERPDRLPTLLAGLPTRRSLADEARPDRPRRLGRERARLVRVEGDGQRQR